MSQLLLAVSSLCWTQPRGRAQTRGRRCLSALRLWQPLPTACGGHTLVTTCRAPQCLGKGSSKRPVLSDLEALHWRRTGEGIQPAPPPRSADTAPVSPPSGRRLPENRTVSPIRLLTPEGRGSASPSGWEWSEGRGCLPLRSGSSGAAPLFTCDVNPAQPPRRPGTPSQLLGHSQPPGTCPCHSPKPWALPLPIRAVLTLGSAG